jgi:hypothetical protein
MSYWPFFYSFYLVFEAVEKELQVSKAMHFYSCFELFRRSPAYTDHYSYFPNKHQKPYPSIVFSINSINNFCQVKPGNVKVVYFAPEDLSAS